MANLRVIHENWTDDLTLTVTSEEGDFTVDRAQMPVAKDVWRATSAAIQRITGDFGQLRRVGALHLENVNFTDAAVITATLENPGLTLTRSTIKHHEDTNGVVQQASAGVGGFAVNGLTIDPQRENKLIRSLPDSANWTERGTGVITENDAEAPDGTTTASLLSGLDVADDGDIYFITASGTFANDGEYRPGFYAKRVSTSGTLTVNNAATGLGIWRLDLSLLSDAWEWIDENHSAVEVLLQAWLANSNGTGGILFEKFSGTGTLSIHIWHINLEEVTTFVTRVIPSNSGSSTTRNADVVSRSTPDRLDADKTNYLYGKYTPFAQAMGEVFLECYRIDADNYVAVILNDTQLILRRRFHGTNHDATLAFTYTAGTTFEWHAVVSKDRGAIWGNGTKGTDNTDTVPLRFAATVHFASDGNTGGIGSGEIADYAFGSDTGLLTDAQVAQLPDSSILPMVVYPMRGSLDCKPYASTFRKWPDDLVMKSATHWFEDSGGNNITDPDGNNITDNAGNILTDKVNFTRPLAQSFILDIDDPDNGDGYVETGRLVLGDYFESQETNARYGYRLGYVEMSQSSRTRGGSLRSENEDPFRVQSFEWAFLTDHDDELYELVDRLWRNRGIRNDIVVSAFPEDTDAKRERLHTVLGRMTNVDGAEYYVQAYRDVPGSYGNIYRVSFTVEETL